MSDRETSDPKRIGRYEIHGSLGTGSMGAVYKGFDPLIKRTLAIKTIRLDVPRDSDEYRIFLERFHQEARISGTLSHPNIVTLYDIGEEAGVPFLAMEFIDGQTLEGLLKRGTRFSAEQAVGVVSQVAAALDYAHSRSVIHRDVKPANLLIFDRDRAKITDFGIAKLADANLTKVGQLLGTPSYMSPEQATGEALDGRSDIFSLGVVAFEVLAGVQPFVGETVPDIVYDIVHKPPQRPHDLAARGLLPAKWEQVFGRALAKRREDRYQSGAELSRELEQCLTSPLTSRGTRPPGFVPAPAPPPVRTIPPRAVVARDETPTPPASPTPDPAGPTEVLALGLDEPTIMMGPDEAQQLGSGDEQAPEPEDAIPETIALTADQVPKLDVDDESPTILTGVVPIGDEATVMMAAGELDGPATQKLEVPPTQKLEVPFTERLEVPPTQKLGPEQLNDLVAHTPLHAPPAESSRASATGLPTPLGGVEETSPAPARPGRGFLVGASVAALLVLLTWGVWNLTGSPQPAPAVGMIEVRTEPPGATISIDGIERGASPVTVAELAEGSYRVEASLAGYEAAQETVSIGPDATERRLELTLAAAGPATGLAEILSSPAGADVAVDGQSVGRTPLRGLELEEGEHEVALALAGHTSWKGRLEVKGGEPVQLSRRLEARPSVPTPAATRAEEPEVAEADQEPAEPEVVEEPTQLAVDTSRIYFLDQLDERPEKRSGDPPPSPKLSRGESVSVTVSYVVEQNGDVSGVQIEESGGRELDDAMVEAIREWKYSPGTVQGVPVKVRFVRKFTFRAG